MNIKEIILNGGRVEFNYKEKVKEYIDSASIYGFSGVHNIKPKVIVTIPTIEIKGRKEFDYCDIDEAISLFERLVLNKKNLCYKMDEAILNLYNNGIILDLDKEEDIKIMMEERLRIIKEN